MNDDASDAVLTLSSGDLYAFTAALLGRIPYACLHLLLPTNYLSSLFYDRLYRVRVYGVGHVIHWHYCKLCACLLA